VVGHYPAAFGAAFTGLTVKRWIVRCLERFGVRLITRNSPVWGGEAKNFEAEFLRIWQACAPFTMTSIDCVYALYRAAGYVVNEGVPGDVVECGVFHGGSIMACAHSLHHFGDHSRSLYLYDTFAGMTEPTELDVDFTGRAAREHLKVWGVSRMSDMAACSQEQVRHNVFTCPYPQDKFVFVEGPVEGTIPGTIPERISILRLDTDWFESTRHELVHLFPRLSPGGVLLIDDYGLWNGARQAVDGYLKANRVPMLLSRIDRTGASIGVKR
jgi:O-methyltransferase